MLLSLHFVYLS